ncbi:TetR/AcrR family transcriptional regulator [Mesorhizobium sp. ES1-1]|uniref:TetR/AcrR family transcriptional regulator n=1 Tax=Mesorhizobium sp. ES1-1 TaxID=2876629 RepID=UPI001CCD1B35|nr:TetR/AcrR family transcriptional regulator [Mesorhizobium sp. ES1-1]MBZ9675025.1 TetR/AcrR family transcriptional regulator [Mesorhizobium sp. ES1-1]
MTLGRPREFDTEAALTKAMRLFWRKGYEGTSLSDLTDEMNITRPSLYAAFGNKEELFLKVLDRYDRETSSFIQAALDAPSARSVAEGLVFGACAFHSDKHNPAGCLMVHGALVGSDESVAMRKETSLRRGGLKDRITQRLKQAQTEGDLPQSTDPAALAGYLVAVLRGMAVEAASGASPADLKGIATVAMAAWPG